MLEQEEKKNTRRNGSVLERAIRFEGRRIPGVNCIPSVKSFNRPRVLRGLRRENTKDRAERRKGRRPEAEPGAGGGPGRVPRGPGWCGPGRSPRAGGEAGGAGRRRRAQHGVSRASWRRRRLLRRRGECCPRGLVAGGAIPGRPGLREATRVVSAREVPGRPRPARRLAQRPRRPASFSGDLLPPVPSSPRVAAWGRDARSLTQEAHPVPPRSAA